MGNGIGRTGRIRSGVQGRGRNRNNNQQNRGGPGRRPQGRNAPVVGSPSSGIPPGVPCTFCGCNAGDDICNRCGSAIVKPRKRRKKREGKRDSQGFSLLEEAEVDFSNVNVKPLYCLSIMPVYKAGSQVPVLSEDHRRAILERIVVPFLHRTYSDTPIPTCPLVIRPRSPRSSRSSEERKSLVLPDELPEFYVLRAPFPCCGVFVKDMQEASDGSTINPTRTYLLQPVKENPSVRKVQILPTRSSVISHLQAKAARAGSRLNPNDPSDWKIPQGEMFPRYVRPYFSGDVKRYMSVGDMFLCNGVQFKVVACQPAHGFVTGETDIYFDGAELPDISKIELLPYWESIAENSLTDSSPSVLMRDFLDPYCCGRFQYLARGNRLFITSNGEAGTGANSLEEGKNTQQRSDDEVRRGGLEFKVTNIECPGGAQGGIVTGRTAIYCSNRPLMRQAEQLLQQQNAMQPPGLRQQGPVQQRRPRHPGITMRAMRGGGPITTRQFNAQLQTWINEMPQNSRERQQLILMQQQLRTLEQRNRGQPVDMRGMFRMMGLPVLGGGGGMGGGGGGGGGGGLGGLAPPGAAAPHEIEALPTQVYKPRQKKEGEDPDQCMVCLEEFQEGETLRRLPCFHAYHKDCIDKWLERVAKCPICKHPVGVNAPN